jgi:hypothetical protein
MEGLLRLSRPQYRDPLIIAEFYNAVQALPIPTRPAPFGRCGISAMPVIATVRIA